MSEVSGPFLHFGDVGFVFEGIGRGGGAGNMLLQVRADLNLQRSSDQQQLIAPRT